MTALHPTFALRGYTGAIFPPHAHPDSDRGNLANTRTPEAGEISRAFDPRLIVIS
jgi:hypothetical protein